MRAAIVEIWPEVEERYEIIEGFYPQVLEERRRPTNWAVRFRPWGARPAASAGAWLDSNAILVFTNVGSGWNEALLALVIESMPRFAEVVLDLRVFGWIRDKDDERNSLFDRIAASARSAERLPDLAGGTHFARFSFGR